MSNVNLIDLRKLNKTVTRENLIVKIQTLKMKHCSLMKLSQLMRKIWSQTLKVLEKLMNQCRALIKKIKKFEPLQNLIENLWIQTANTVF